MILFFDTETSGKLNYRAHYTSVEQPDIVQLAAILYDDIEDRTAAMINLIVEPEGFIISEEVSKIHGITHEYAMRAGLPRRTVLSAFTHMCKQAVEIVAHNLSFDWEVTRTAFYRIGCDARTGHLKKTCTMTAATPVLKLPKPFKGKAGDLFKWPTLTECYQHFFGTTFDGAHNALNDVTAMIDVWKQLRLIGAL